MRSNSGKDEKRNNFRDPTLKDREAERGMSGAAVLDKDAHQGSIEDNEGQRTTGLGSAARKSGEEGAADQRNAVVVRDPVEREAQHQLAGAGRPAERGFRLAHALAGADDPPQDVGQARPGRGDRRSKRRRASIWAALRSIPADEPPRWRADRRRVPRHRHLRRQPRPLPVAAQLLAGIELAAADQAARQQPAERRFARVDRHRPHRRVAAGARSVSPSRADRPLDQDPSAAGTLSLISVSLLELREALATAAKL